MFEDMFPFTEPIVELDEDTSSFVIQAEAFFEFLRKSGLDKKPVGPHGTTIELPVDVIISLLRPDELEKLRNYVTMYLAKHGGENP
jgi:uncharacterized protein YqgV (UPF0045/DUF77 family)